MDITLPKDIPSYLEQLNELERKAHDIAQSHLGSSFHIGRSNGLKEWRALQSELELFLNSIDRELANKILETKRKEGPTYRIDDLEEFKEWQKLQAEIKQFLNSIEKTLAKSILERKETWGPKYRVEDSEEFQVWKANLNK